MLQTLQVGVVENKCLCMICFMDTSGLIDLDCHPDWPDE